MLIWLKTLTMELSALKYFLIVKVGFTNFNEMSMGIFVTTALFIGIEPSNTVCYNNDRCNRATT